MSIYPAFGYVMLVTRHIISILYCFWAIRFWPHYWKISYIETHIVSDFDTGRPIFRKNIWVDSNSQAPLALKPLGFVVAESALRIWLFSTADLYGAETTAVINDDRKALRPYREPYMGET